MDEYVIGGTIRANLTKEVGINVFDVVERDGKLMIVGPVGYTANSFREYGYPHVHEYPKSRIQERGEYVGIDTVDEKGRPLSIVFRK